MTSPSHEQLIARLVVAALCAAGTVVALVAVIAERSLTSVALALVCTGTSCFHAGRAYAAHKIRRRIRSTAHRTT